MFQEARIKLTAWYLVIIMLVSMFFSMGIYKDLCLEYDRIQRTHNLRMQRESLDFFAQFVLEQKLVDESKNRIKLALIAVNLIILGTAGVAGYFLAGKTLKPISDMIDDQRRFISDASHELRTPITALKSEIEVNLRDEGLTLADSKKILKSNLEEANNLQNLSDKLIKLTRYGRDTNHFVPRQIDLADVAKASIKQISALAKDKKITLVNKVPRIKIEAEKESLTELFIIFLDNAVKYSPPRKKVEVEARKTDGHVVINFVDRGIGIAESDLPHLFDRFYRGDKSRTKSETSGYGLGLAIAKEIVERHGGDIKVKSKSGLGTTFSVSLPKNQHSLRNYL
jgi:two-component system, OmpR family, sensor histidine kinase CiaH